MTDKPIMCDDDEIERLTAENARLRAVVAAVIELRKWGVQFDDDRLRYITVQVDRADVERLDAALEAKP